MGKSNDLRARLQELRILNRELVRENQYLRDFIVNYIEKGNALLQKSALTESFSAEALMEKENQNLADSIDTQDIFPYTDEKNHETKITAHKSEKEVTYGLRSGI